MIRHKSIAEPTEMRTQVHNSGIAAALKDENANTSSFIWHSNVPKQKSNVIPDETCHEINCAETTQCALRNTKMKIRLHTENPIRLMSNATELQVSENLKKIKTNDVYA